mgnify:CR=1 FL=1
MDTLNPTDDDSTCRRCDALNEVIDADGAMPMWVVDCLNSIFSALADPTRLRIVHALVENDKLNVTGLADFAGLSVSAVSHQLRILRDRGLVRAQRDGRMVHYSLADDHLRRLFCTGVQHAHEDCTSSLRREAERSA